MKLNVQTDYALRVLIHVALNDRGLVRMSDIASDFAISHNHLTKVVHRLSLLGYATTVQGRNGGIRLARSPQDINVGQVVRDFEPDFRLVECMGPEKSSCRIESACVLRKVLNSARDCFLAELDQFTLAALVRPRHKLQILLGLPKKGLSAKA